MSTKKTEKIHPTGFRAPRAHHATSRWYANSQNFASVLAEDLKVRDYLKAKLKNAAVSRILIERPAKNARITIYSARPGVVIGKKGEDIENLKAELTKRLGVPVAVNIEEVRKPEIDAQLIADSITQQLEKRIMFRRAMKRAMQNAMRLGAQGIKIMSAGRLNGIEIARTEWYREGRVPLHTLKADIDYGFSEAKTTYGVIGVKVWVYRGDRLAAGEAPLFKPGGAISSRAPIKAPLRVRRHHPDQASSAPASSASSQRDQVATTVAASAVLVKSRRLSSASERARASMLAGLPAWASQQQASDVSRLKMTLGGDVEPDRLLEMLGSEPPAPIHMRSNAEGGRFDTKKQYAVLGRFASGVVRTVGSIKVAHDGVGKFVPFGFWSLLDPDDESLNPKSTRQIETTVDLLAVGSF